MTGRASPSHDCCAPARHCRACGAPEGQGARVAGRAVILARADGSITTAPTELVSYVKRGDRSAWNPEFARLSYDQSGDHLFLGEVNAAGEARVRLFDDAHCERDRSAPLFSSRLEETGAVLAVTPTIAASTIVRIRIAARNMEPPVSSTAHAADTSDGPGTSQNATTSQTKRLSFSPRVARRTFRGRT